MDDTLFMQVRHGKAELAKDDLGLVLGQTTFLRKVVEELAAGTELSNDPDGGLCRDDFVHLGDVWVVELAMVVDFAGKGCRHGLGDLLDGDPG